MHPNLRLTAVCWIATAAIAQAPRVDAATLGSATGIRASTGLVALPDGALAGGRDYEARFAAGGVTFLPVFGSRAPETMPLRLELLTIRRGERIVHAAAPDVAPAVDATARAVTFARGDVVERYDVRVDGLEQSFRFDRPLPGRGDLVVRLAVATALQPRARADGTLAFALPGVGEVTVGAVTGIDADGDRADGSLRLAGGAIELVLPAVFVDGASYPLVLDPLVGVQFYVSTGGYDDQESDVAYDATNDQFLVTWRRRFSATNSLIRGQFVSGGGALVGATMFFTPIGSQVQKRARVCNVNAPNRFLCVWEESPFLAGPRDLVGTLVTAGSGAQSATVVLIGTAADERSPSLAGDPTTTDDEALLAWSDGSDWRVRQVLVPAVGDPSMAGNLPVLAPAGLAANLTLAKSVGASGRLLAVWTQYGGPDAEIAAQALTKDAGLIGGVVSVTNNTADEGAPAVDGDGNRFVVAFERYEAGGTRDIVAQAVHVNGGGAAAVGSENVLGGTAASNEFAPDVCCLGSKFAVFWQHEFAGFFDDIYGTVVAPDCAECGQTFLLGGLNGPNYNYEARPRCIGRFAGSTTASANGFVTFSESENVPPFEGEVIGQRFAYVDQVTNLGGGCGAGGTIHAPCLEVGNPNFAVSLSGAGANRAAVLMLGHVQNGRSCGSCTLVPDVWTGYPAPAPNTNAFGNTQLVIAIPPDASLVGYGLFAQWATAGTNCFASTADLSNGIRATIQ
jgi:hypothetical protein